MYKSNLICRERQHILRIRNSFNMIAYKFKIKTRIFFHSEIKLLMTSPEKKVDKLSIYSNVS